MGLTIKSPSRIHIGLIDLNGSIGRIDGGVGIALDFPNFYIEGKESSEIEIEVKSKGIQEDILRSIKDRLLWVSKKVLNYIGEDGIYIKVKSIIPLHSGLGSGTQMALSTGMLISKIYKKDLDVKTLASITGRGGTSGIGVYAFERGGFIVDGGHTFGKGKDKERFSPSSASKNVRTPPLIFRHDFNWSVVLTIPKGENIHGEREIDIFKRYCPVPLEETQKICHIILMKMLPAVVEEDIVSFGESINKLQYLGFKRVEVGLQRDTVKDLLKELQKVSYSGLSSFGPTLYSICNGREDIKKVVETSKEFFDRRGIDGEVVITKGNNEGFKINI
ncbi:MAG TPA: hypothetical protein EYG87_01320 [Methanothermococcus okinawensis]|uniref:Beta-ribofuranosylaminobenzene 5'-phosphate synthase n=1 Tax=Methanofervidicoccus abyssi TaxID=2082189 RepID=A0A401HQE3_9EURY|nr:beta-ribofuranosylaminobenzene 5'-phosphate synthase [Methanofervidicoccus abyssi]GBF36361.1 beta-ribofuranosylaminobenzene 5'-phosphate synthase [Methanofervidicoccus abyssi]HIP16108.1 hypothetical protein [Methanothermococcus okinawensis]HIP34673.1 hypothetical protein [Methanothermococcus okinawensis]